jgi:hypothetical protein
MLKNIWNVTCALLLIGGGVWWVSLAWREREMVRFKERDRVAALHADSIRAARDTSRAVLLSVAGDSVRVYQRRIVQVKQRSDSLDRALGLERAARYRVEAAVSALSALAAAPALDSTDGVRTAEFRVREPPFYIDVTVGLPRPPGEGRMALRVALDTAVLEARVGCGAVGAGGVRPATLSLTGPRWVGVRITRVEQEVRVCSPTEPIVPRTSLLARVAKGFHVGVGYGAVIAPDGRIVRGPGINVSWSPWP